MATLYRSYGDAWEGFAGATHMESFLDSQPVTTKYLLSWQVPVSREVGEATGELRRSLAALGDFVIIPDELLHVSVAPIGLTDEVDHQLERRQLDEGRKAWRPLGPFRVRYGPVSCFPTAVVAEVHDRGVFEALGLLRDLPPPPTFLPHMTLALAASRRPAAPVRNLLAPLRDGQFLLGEQVVDRVQLCRIRMGPGSLLEQWEVVGEVHLS